MADREASRSPASRRPSETAQAAVSVALAVYLVGLVLAIAGNSESGSSALLRTVKSRLFTPWMAPVWLDLGFDHPLTYGMPEDADHTLELGGWGDVGPPVLRPGTLSGERAARWRRLARRIAVAATADTAAPLAAGVGSGGFAALGTEDVVVRVVRTPLEARVSTAAAASPAQVYAARVRLVGGETQLLELGGAAKRGELAPVLDRRSADDVQAGEGDGGEVLP